MEEHFGLETFLRVEKERTNSCEDVAVVVAHWVISSNNLLCVGHGEMFKTGEKKSELMPEGWNREGTVYTLRYINTQDNQFLFKVIKVDNMLIMSILALKTESSSDLTIIPADYINVEKEVTFTKLDELIGKIRKELVEKVVQPKSESKKNNSSEGEKDSKTPGKDPLLEGGGRGGRVNPGMPDWGGVGAPPLGSSDLDPLGGIMGGGMIMDPRQGGRMGQPVHPRFDPVGPGMGGIGPLGGGMGGGAGPFGGGMGGNGGGMGGGIGGGGRGRNFGDAMRPPGWDNMFM